MTETEREDIEGALAFLERTGSHPPATAAAAYVKHVPVLLDEVDRLRRVISMMADPTLHNDIEAEV